MMKRKVQREVGLMHLAIVPSEKVLKYASRIDNLKLCNRKKFVIVDEKCTTTITMPTELEDVSK